MEFINLGGPVKIRIGKLRNCHWSTIRKREKVELSREQGRILGLTEIKTTEGQIGSVKVETKQIEVPEKQVQSVPEKQVQSVPETNDFFKELCLIKGIGKKTADDITKIFPEREELIKTIRLNANKNALPLRDDIAKILEDKYGRK